VGQDGTGEPDSRAVAYTMRGEIIRLISARKANQYRPIKPSDLSPHV
jgi:uncharacterized DUF497 family protein